MILFLPYRSPPSRYGTQKGPSACPDHRVRRLGSCHRLRHPSIQPQVSRPPPPLKTLQMFSNDTISLIGFPGEIFMQIVEMMILPLIISSVISALAQVRAKDARRIGIITVIYYLITTFLSTFVSFSLNIKGYSNL